MMRLALLLVSVLAMTACSSVDAAMRPDIWLVKGGQAKSALVLPAEPHEDETLAAEELQSHIEKMTGAKLTIATGSAPEGLMPVRIGLALSPDAEAAIRAESDDASSYRIVADDNGVSLAGLTPEATLFAAYDLLEQTGVRWYMPGDIGTVIPDTSNVAVVNQADVHVPSFTSRHLQTLSRNTPWYRRQRMGGVYFPSAHGVKTLPKATFDTHPEFFALRDGKRSKRQHCVSNPELVKGAIAYANDYFDKHPEMIWLGVGPNDGGGFCECENCKALDSGEWDPYAAEHSVTDRYVWLFNQILEGIEEKHPDKKIGFYAYHAYKLPPRVHKPNPRIAPAFAPITLCRIHGMDNPVCPDRTFYKTIMEDWGALVPEVYERGYYFNLADPGLPFSKVHAVRKETPIAHKAGVTGWRVECMPSWANDTPTLFIASRLMWDVNADVDALLADFFDKFFGPASKPMGEYITMVDEGWRDIDAHSGGSFAVPHVFTPQRVERGRALLTAAEKAAGTDTVYAERIRMWRWSFARLEAFLNMLEQRNRFDFAAAKQSLDKWRALTDTALRYQLYPNPSRMLPEGEQTKIGPLYWRSAHSYIRRFWAPTTESGYKHLVEEKGDLVAGFPDEWDFHIDRNDIGEMAHWYADGKIGGNWQRMKTTSATWGDQGLHYYKGLAWYRTQVDVPASFKGRRILLWFGGVDELAKVWVNGQLLGTNREPGHGLPGVAGTFLPFNLDATEAVRFGESNTIAVKITNERLNELGTGGIVSPVMFWSPSEVAPAQE